MSKTFILLNILYTILQVAILFLLVFFVFPGNDILLYVTAGLFGLFIGGWIKQIRSNPFKKLVVDSDQEKLDEYKELIEKAISLKGKDVPIYFVKYKPLLNPAFYYKGAVYINIATNRMPEYAFEGLLAHEFGHAISGYADRLVYLNIRITVLLATLIKQFRQRIINKKKKLPNKYLDGFLYYLMRFISLGDDLLLYRFIREEEHKANRIACSLTDGHSLRTYYYYVGQRKKKDNYNFDLLHPFPFDMIDQMEPLMSINDKYHCIYPVDHKIYYIDHKERKTDLRQLKFEYYKDLAIQVFGNKELKNTNYILEYVGNAYEKGIGTMPNLGQAILFYQRSVEKGSTIAHLKLGRAYEKSTQYEQALVHYRLAKENNHNVDAAIKRVEQRIISLMDIDTNIEA